MKRETLALMIFFIVSLQSFAQQHKPSQEALSSDSTAVTVIEQDDPIVSMLDSLASLTIFNTDNLQKAIKNSAFPPGFVPEYSDSIIKARIEKLNLTSSYRFIYNPAVKPFIELYANRRRELTQRIMGLGEIYFPFFEEQLDKYNLPLELKYLAVIESALNPQARSRVGATGLWQFMYGTGRMYKLNVNSYVDDRSDPIKATNAACLHFIDLYNIYGDWNLVIAAYNAGAGNVNRAIRRAGGVKDFWYVRRFLPRETQNYVPGFIAATYVFEYADEHNLHPIYPKYSHNDLDTIHIKKIVPFSSITEIIGIPLDELCYLNPSFRKNIVPGSPENPYALRLPRDYANLFVLNEETIYNLKNDEQIKQEELAFKVPETTIHVVRKGEVLGSIARKYHCSVREIQHWNNMRGTNIRVGQRLVVRAPEKPVLSPKNNVHIVVKGESLASIASKYNLTADELLAINNLSSNKIHPGQKLIVKKDKNTVSKITNSGTNIDNKQVASNNKVIYYTVQSGDTLWTIAQKHEGTSVEEIQKLNNLSSQNLQPGQTLKIAVAAK